MTNPVPVQQGNPDWGRQIAYGAIKILRYSQATANLAVVGPIYAGNLPFMYLSLSASLSVELGVAWFMDSAGTQSLFGDVVTIDTFATEAKVCIPVRGPYVKFTFLHSGVTPTISLDVFSVPSRFNVYSFDGGGNALITAMNQNVAAGTNTAYRAAGVRAGRASWFVDSIGGTTFTAYLIASDYLGVTTIIDAVRAPARALSRQIYIPAMPMAIQVFNQDGVARDFQTSLLYHPFDD